MVRFGSAVNCPIAESLPSGCRACSKKPLKGAPEVDFNIRFSVEPGATLSLPADRVNGGELCWGDTFWCFGDIAEQVAGGAPIG